MTRDDIEKFIRINEDRLTIQDIMFYTGVTLDELHAIYDKVYTIPAWQMMTTSERWRLTDCRKYRAIHPISVTDIKEK